MKSCFLLPAVLVFALVLPLSAQVDVSHQRLVYNQINKNEAAYKRVSVSTTLGDLQWELNGWFDGNELRKIEAKVPGEDGDCSTEFYLEKDELVFVFRTYTAAGARKEKFENRYYFKDWEMVQWIGPDKKAVDPKNADYMPEKAGLTDKAMKFGIALKEKRLVGAPVQVLEGVFTGIEEGDYYHWDMRSTAGKQTSFFILKADASVDRVVTNAKAFVGKKCRIKWKPSVVTIPEEGGKIELDQILSVEWITGQKK
ncbi:MAG: hypothetical protein K1X78_17910 [Verrucomicrobiaceae bacterium]|nr:hypothetical protein [Verrucomicrobiaceae bacterium]